MKHCCDHTRHQTPRAEHHHHTHHCQPRSEPVGQTVSCVSDDHGTSEKVAAGDDDGPGRAHSWRIGGMDCPSCASKIETAVRRLPGVLSAEVRFSTERLLVQLTPEVSPHAVTQAIRGAGFTPIDEQKAEHRPATVPSTPWQDNRSILVLLALIVAAGGASLLLPVVAPALFTLATLWGIWPIGRKALQLARSGSPFSIETLMTVAACGALLLGETAEAAMVLLLFLIGEKLESLAANKARKGVKALMALVPNQALRVTANGLEKVTAASLRPDDEIEVHPGGRLPVDGTLLTELAAFDESAVTGESLPVERSRGERLAAGSLLVDVAVRVRVTSTSGNNTIDRILHLMEQAESNRAPIARFIERFSRWYTPAMILAATLVALVPPLLMSADWATWTYRGLVLLLIGCPCALVISTPAAVTSALASASRMGILIKGGAALEQLGKINTLAFDKTGTLTQGEPRLQQLIIFPPFERKLVLTLAAGLEAGSHHPLARALVTAAETEGIQPENLPHRRTLPGAGIESEWQGQPLKICTPAHLNAGQLTAGQQAEIDRLRADAHTLVVLVIGEQIAALFALSDPLRADARVAVAALQQLNIRCLMLTGDHQTAAARIADELGIDYRAELKPEDKLEAIMQLGASRQLAMVGDGINDAPALKQASVGIAMGQGTDVALDSADAALTHNRLTGLADAVRLSRATHRNIRQNITLALGLKAVFLVTSVLGITGLWLAVLADTGATALVTLNALRLLTVRSQE
ncbi:heavy metal translocating P-type ATPase [Oceanisphaera psychrotolerans]|uniref:P-type Zn(2+) transporter n=1 Tax=Oceanisphaera psychrotolerans TaxID=1414654 RepID=A0A1J4QC07_9GAMM|nr:heavy metal translocating P-type ATPase [Oceanisphaera psychrotolerans]OIN08527.1 zinc/cadmium/mercury/lead-transporting ATPase [Oceanisphaera psychrotolerans]